MRPIIGITSDIRNENLLTVSLNNVHAIVKAGGVPVVLPNIADAAVERFAETIDGLLVTGGGDADPTFYGEEPLPQLGEVCPDRDRFELLLINRMLQKDKPVLGICRGCQMIIVAAGGNLYQDIYSQHRTQLLQHTQKAPRTHTSHYVEIAEGSLLHGIVQSSRFKVNSFHHQAVKTVADGFAITGRASDGIIEAYESNNHRFVIGVQWHPENLACADDIYSLRLFNALVHACR